MQPRPSNIELGKNFLCRISDRLLFIRAADSDEVSKLTGGRSFEVYLRDLAIDTNTIRGLIERGEVTKNYGLEEMIFNFNHRSVEFVIRNNLYASFETLVKQTVAEKPEIKWKDFLRLEWSRSVAFARKEAGRPKAGRDAETGKLVNINKEVKETIEAWDGGMDIEAIRFLLNPKTKMPTTKSVEIQKIKRNLRRYNHLLIRTYSTK